MLVHLVAAPHDRLWRGGAISCSHVCVYSGPRSQLRSGATSKPATTPRLNRWRKSLSGYLALNVDASFSEDEHTESCGAIIRDSGGMFVAASTSKLEHVADIVSAESAALVEGLKLALTIGCNAIFIQMDNLVVVEALKLNTRHSHDLSTYT